MTELNYLFWDGKENFERFQKFQQRVANDPILRVNFEEISLSRQEKYEKYALRAKRFFEWADLRDIKEYATVIQSEALVGSMQYEMFIPTLQNLCTPEQAKKFLEPALRYEIIGCYAQTELGHGSDMNRIETTATFDKNTQEFVLNTPSTKSIKWWGTDLGLTSNHAVVLAQLVIDGRKHGVQFFLVQTRDLKTHEPLGGISVGDIGPKFGFNTKDNGFLKLDNVRIPHDQMLQKYTKVLPNGTVEKIGDDKIWHATMQTMRQHMLDVSWRSLGMGIQIAMNYSIKRTQFKNQNGKEIPIIDYLTQKHKIIPFVAEFFGNMYGSKRIYKMCQQSMELVNRQDFSMMMEIHVVLAAAKAQYTQNTQFAFETLRQSLGGHGFSQFSGLPQLILEFMPCIHAEGDNTILALSVGKILLSYLNKSMQSGKAPNETCDYLTDIFSYLSEIQQPLQNEKDVYDIIKLREVLRYGVAFNVANCGQQLQQLMGDGKTFRTACDHHLGLLLLSISRTQCNYFTMKVFTEELQKIQCPDLKEKVIKVCQLYGILKILESQTDLFEYGVLTSQTIGMLKKARDELITEITQFALQLVEGQGYDESLLRSAIGTSDPNMYEKLMEVVKTKNPVNEKAFQKEIFQKLKSYRGPPAQSKL